MKFLFKIGTYGLFLSVFLLACNNSSNNGQQAQNSKVSTHNTAINQYSESQIKYAKWFTINYYEDYKQIDVINPWAKGVYWSYKCYSDSVIFSSKGKESNIGRIKSSAVLSSTVVGMFKALGIENKIKAIGNVKYIADTSIVNRVEEGDIVQVGDMSNINKETLVLNKINIIFDSAWNTIAPNAQKLMDENIPTAFILDWQEQTPLARAEWIKFVGAFFNLESLADSVFNEVEKDYLKIKQSVQDKGLSLKILHASPMSGTWYVAGGKSYMAQLYQDAGADYLWSADTTTGSLPLSFEAIFLKAQNADVWFTSSSSNQLKDFVQEDKRYQLFKSVKNKQVISLKPMQENGRPNAFWEEGSVFPNLILKDLINILYNQKTINPSELKYYQRLR